MVPAPPPVVRARRKKTRTYLRRHKALRIQEQQKERRLAEKSLANLDRKLGRSSGRADAAFKGCREVNHEARD